MNISGVSLSPGTSSRLGISVKLIDVDDSVLSRYPHPVDRDCYLSTDVKFKFLNYEDDYQYSISNCYFEAAMQKAVETCDCLPGLYVVSDSETACEGPSLKCFFDILAKTGSNFFKSSFLNPRKLTFQETIEISRILLLTPVNLACPLAMNRFIQLKPLHHPFQ